MKDHNFRLRWIPIGEHAGRDGHLKLLETPFPSREVSGIDDLVESILRHGVLSPLLVREVPGALQVVCGYSRYQAATAAGLKSVPVLIADLSDAEALRAYLSEKVVRKSIGVESSPVSAGPREQSSASTAHLPAGEAATEDTVPRRRLTAHAGNRRLKSRAGETTSMLSTLSSKAHEAATRLLKRTESLFNEAPVQRRLPPDQVEGIIDSLVALVTEHEGVDFRVLVPQQGDKDPTPAHSLVVATMCHRVAPHFDYTEVQTRSLLTAALLHDIGMTFIRETALQSPQTLQRSREHLLHSHPRIGCAIIQATSAWPLPVAWCARDHHERYDGSGYPARKKAREVCTMARLMGLVDSYCALTSPRAHREALTSAAAWDRLERATAQGLFDPVLFRHLTTPSRNFTEMPSRPAIAKAQPRFRGNTIAMTKATDKIHPDG